MSLLSWLSLVAIIWLQSINGTNSDFPAYSSQLKLRLSISQVQLNNLAVASDAGKLFGWISGMAARFLPLPVVLSIGASLGLISYGIEYLFMVNKISHISYTGFFLLNMMAGNSICWINTVCYLASMEKFPADNGIVVGLATSYQGLSAKVYIALAQVILGTKQPKNKSIYLLLNSVLPILASFILMPFFKETKPVVSVNRRGLGTMFVIACLTGAYAVCETMVNTKRVLSLILLAMVILVCIVPVMKVGEWLRERACKPMRVTGELQMSTGVVVLVEDNINGDAMEEESGMKVVRVGDEHGVRELVKSVDFWLYFLVYLSGATLGLVYGNNLGQIAESRGVSEAILVSISSSFVFFGKLSSAPLSALSRTRYMISRPATVAVLMAPMAGSFFLLLNNSNACLFISTAIMAMSSGAITSIAVSMTSELFGPKNFGVNHNIVVANIPVGSFLFGYLAAWFYDAQGAHGLCMGSKCYQKAFIAWGSICSVGTILSFVLYYRTRRSLMKN
ncbi:hypothetical protein J5N97_017485 [Dioscorea zingiberensis]|uniref:Nodulin-like domain-containing protein n=1 Tax=Dioscorea zingiberensis TaxID=325984 RepID=A0A9D5CP59_9LILI|nr:hypothetical protein J5N97_017485 [Dioscorea zingiberensis]